MICTLCTKKFNYTDMHRKRLKTVRGLNNEIICNAGYHYICRNCSNMYYKKYQGIGIKEYRKTVSRRIYADL